MNYKMRRLLKIELARFPFRIGKLIRLNFFTIFKGTYLSYIPDKYAFNLGWYKTLKHAFYNEKNIKGWVNKSYLNNAGDLVRFFFLNMALEQLTKENIGGDIAEIGVYKGNSAFLFAQFARQTNRQLYLFDTFNGFDERDLKGIDLNKKASFADTDLESVKIAVGTDNVTYVPGYFPESLSQVSEDDILSFSLVHIDCDLEKPIKDALHYFYPKISKGGFLLIHDYANWDGATKAIDEFFKDKIEKIIPIPDKSGTVVIRKF
ncbi:MAG TPA: TylF/MycF/NovP-related O-methyltransferase [Segetibacter sp.]|jgi:hypothetical protein